MREPALLLGLLGLTLATAGALVYEAWRSGQAEQETVSSALQGYASYTSWNVSRLADQGMGSAMAVAFRYVLMDTVSTEESLPPLSRIRDGVRYAEACKCVPLFHATHYFSHDLRTGALRSTTGDWRELPPDSVLRDAVLSLQHADLEEDFAAILGPRAEAKWLMGYVSIRNTQGKPAGILGFLTGAPDAARGVFDWLLQHNKVLPAGFTDGLAADSLVSISVRAPDGSLLYHNNGGEPTVASDTATLGVLPAGLHIFTGLRPTALKVLPLGTRHQQRTPVLIGLLLLTAGSAVLVLLHMRREHELARTRSEFTASVSHELRTPLAQILLYGEMLVLERSRTWQKRRMAGEVIVREARRLMHLVENALHFTRADRGVVLLTPVVTPVAPIIREVLDGFAPLAWAADTKLQVELDPTAVALIDRGAVRQILLNLLDNAIKYGPQGQTVLVRLAAAGDVIRLSVQDEGPGIARQDREVVWHPFVRGAGTGPGATGSGLGLAVVRDLAVRLGGRTEIADRDGAGSCVIVELPARELSPAAEAGRAEQAEAARPTV